jgi:hypothetical protein
MSCHAHICLRRAETGHGVQLSPNQAYGEVPRCFFPLRYGNRVTLYHDAHQPHGVLQDVSVCEHAFNDSSLVMHYLLLVCTWHSLLKHLAARATHHGLLVLHTTAFLMLALGRC